MGKTSFALSIARNCAAGHGFPCAVFSLEMSSEQLAERLLCAEAEVDSSALRQGRLVARDMTNMTYAADTLSKAPIVIDDTPALTIRELRARARRFVADRDIMGEKPFGLIVVDYLQLMSGGQTKRSGGSNREQEISEISRGLKALAKEIHCPILALSQLNRSVESRDNKRPHLADLRESGAIEQDADMIMFIYRDEVYNPETEDKGVAEIIIGKNRHGPTDTIRTRFDGRYTRFSNLSNRTSEY
jgi:replicative DNA helicase